MQRRNTDFVTAIVSPQEIERRSENQQNNAINAIVLARILPRRRKERISSYRSIFEWLYGARMKMVPTLNTLLITSTAKHRRGYSLQKTAAQSEQIKKALGGCFSMISADPFPEQPIPHQIEDRRRNIGQQRAKH